MCIELISMELKSSCAFNFCSSCSLSSCVLFSEVLLEADCNTSDRCASAPEIDLNLSNCQRLSARMQGLDLLTVPPLRQVRKEERKYGHPSITWHSAPTTVCAYNTIRCPRTTSASVPFSLPTRHNRSGYTSPDKCHTSSDCASGAMT